MKTNNLVNEMAKAIREEAETYSAFPSDSDILIMVANRLANEHADLQRTIEAQRQKEFSMAQCIGELENDLDDLTQLYLDQLERTNEVGEELWELNMQIDLIGTSQEDQTCPFCHAPYEVDITYNEYSEDCPESHWDDTEIPF